MVDRTQIREHMDVIASDGERLGKVDSIDGDRIKLTEDASPDGQHHFVEIGDVSRVDEHVHLTKTRAAVLGAAATIAAASHTHAAKALPPIKNPAVESAKPRRNYMLPWVLGALALLALILLLTQCLRNDDRKTRTRTTTEQTTMQRVAGAPLREGTLAYQLDQFLTSSDGLPRTFTFDRLNFDSGSAAIRSADNGDLDDIARVFAAYPKARAAIVGYTDAQGSAASNKELGADRARSVIAALQQRGVDGGRFEARTGGESDPTATNAAAGGRFSNRRTELVVLKR